MKYFVTGATGFIGGELARPLIEAGHHVTALVRTPSKAGALRALGFTARPLAEDWPPTVEHELRCLSKGGQ